MKTEKQGLTINPLDGSFEKKETLSDGSIKSLIIKSRKKGCYSIEGALVLKDKILRTQVILDGALRVTRHASLTQKRDGSELEAVLDFKSNSTVYNKKGIKVCTISVNTQDKTPTSTITKYWDDGSKRDEIISKYALVTTSFAREHDRNGERSKINSIVNTIAPMSRVDNILSEISDKIEHVWDINLRHKPKRPQAKSKKKSPVKKANNE